jgi:hypothetical protein
MAQAIASDLVIIFESEQDARRVNDVLPKRLGPPSGKRESQGTAENFSPSWTPLLDAPKLASAGGHPPRVGAGLLPTPLLLAVVFSMDAIDLRRR